MKAMIFAAGLGTRLRPITNDRPKALAEINDVTLLEIAVKRLKIHGFEEIIINVHHYADMVEDYLKSHDNFGANITISDERAQLLDTGGGLKKASWFFNKNEPFLLYNVDIITDVDLTAFYEFHKKNKALATLLVRHRPGNRFLLMAPGNRLCGWENTATGEKIIACPIDSEFERIAFSGLHVIDPLLFDLMTENGVFSIVQTYLRLARDHMILGYVDDSSYWMDAGTPQKLKKAGSEIDLQKLLGEEG